MRLQYRPATAQMSPFYFEQKNSFREETLVVCQSRGGAPI
jgi:hypothetical protein